MSGYCSLQATSRAVVQRGAMHLAEAGRRRRRLARSSRSGARQSGPSSLPMRRRTKAQPIAGAFACKLRQFRGVFRRAARRARWRGTAPPSSAGPSARRGWSCRSSACAARSVLMPNTRSPATRAAMPPTAPEVRAKRRSSPNSEARSSASGHQAVASSSSMKPAITSSPRFQNAGSDASRPNGASSSLCRLRAAGAQHVEVLRLEAGMAGLEHRIQRVHQAIAEGIGIDVERRVDEVRHIGPEHACIPA